MEVEVTFEYVLNKLYTITTISDVFKNWPDEREKEELIEEIIKDEI